MLLAYCLYLDIAHEKYCEVDKMYLFKFLKHRLKADKRVCVTYVMECSFSCTLVIILKAQKLLKSVVEKSRSESWLVPQAAQLRKLVISRLVEYVIILLKRGRSMKSKMRMIEAAIVVRRVSCLGVASPYSFGNSFFSKSFWKSWTTRDICRANVQVKTIYANQRKFWKSINNLRFLDNFPSIQVFIYYWFFVVWV